MSAERDIIAETATDLALPPGVTRGDELEVTWESDDLSTTVKVVLGEVSILVECSHEAAPTVPWVVATLPEILERAWDAIESDTNQQEDA